jgi:phosphate transport system substrate-binding protein
MSSELGRRPALVGLGMALVSGAAGCSERRFVDVRGAGATAQVATYRAWFEAFERDRPHVRLDYLPIASGGGLRQLALGAVDFAVSDVEVDEEDRRSLGRTCLFLPTGLGAIAIALHLPGASEATPLVLPLRVLARMFLGEIRAWNHLEIAEHNPGVRLPDLAVVPVVRADGGGSTAVLGRALAAVSEPFAERVGTGRQLAFPAGIGARGSDGVLRAVRATPGAIGYVEAGRAVRSGLVVAALDDEAGAPTLPDPAAIARAASGVRIDSGRAVVVERSGYPLTSLAQLVVPVEHDDARRGSAVARFAYFALSEGQALLEASDARVAGLAPLPRAIAEWARGELRAGWTGSLRDLGID